MWKLPFPINYFNPHYYRISAQPGQRCKSPSAVHPQRLFTGFFWWYTIFLSVVIWMKTNSNQQQWCLPKVQCNRPLQQWCLSKAQRLQFTKTWTFRNDTFSHPWQALTLLMINCTALWVTAVRKRLALFSIRSSHLFRPKRLDFESFPLCFRFQVMKSSKNDFTIFTTIAQGWKVTELPNATERTLTPWRTISRTDTFSWTRQISRVRKYMQKLQF